MQPHTNQHVPSQLGANTTLNFAGELLVAETAEVDFNRTPRHSTFQSDIQNDYEGISTYSSNQVQISLQQTPSYQMAEPEGSLNDATSAMDFESYTMGLGDMGILPPTLVMSPYEELAFTDYLVVDPEA